jgi:diacylglycerol kinase (ATP)
MKFIKIIYNPISGRGAAEDRVNHVARILLDRGYTVNKYATQEQGDGRKHAKESANDLWDLIIAAGGDGTINEIASGIYESGSMTPMAILHEGTMNDIARHLGISNDPIEFCNMIDTFYYEAIDLGKSKKKYFLNVVAGGMLTAVAHKTPVELKHMFGRAAYYLEVLRELTSSGLRSFPLRIEHEGFSNEGRFNLFIISNSPTIGGFDQLVPLAEMQDGLLDCIFIKESENIQKAAELFLAVLKGEHINHSKVLYFRTNKLEITSIEASEENAKIELDFDGEYAGGLPLTIEIIPSAINILVKRK